MRALFLSNDREGIERLAPAVGEIAEGDEQERSSAVVVATSTPWKTGEDASVNA